MKITRTKIISGCLIVGALSLFAYYEYTRHLDEELVGKLKNELSELHLKNPGIFVYQETSADHDCDKAHVTVVYASDKEADEICNSFLSTLSSEKWQPQHMQQKTDYCESRPLKSIALTARARSNPNGLILQVEAYPKEAAYENTFMPVNIYKELYIKKEAVRHEKKSFYYVGLMYFGPDNSAKCPCEESGVCEIGNPTFYESTEVNMQDDKTVRP